MTPTPSPHSSFHEQFRFGRNRRQRTANPYPAANHVTPTQLQAQTPTQPQTETPPTRHDLMSDDDGDVEDIEQEEDGDLDDEIEHGVNEVHEGEEEEEGEEGEEEGGIEEDIIRGQGRTTPVLPSPPPPRTRAFVTLPRPVLPARRTPTPNPPEDQRLWQRMFRLGLTDTSSGVAPMDLEPEFDPTALGLKEIGNLASWTVSTCKPGSGVEALRHEDTQLFWQSDGPQPHHLNIHFSRLVSILSIRMFLDFEQDESYTPTRISLLAGTGYHDLLPFAQLEFAQPKGWIDVPLEHVGGGEEGKMLKTFLVQVKIIENHQNGKDTHVRGLKVYARDDRIGRGGFPTMDGFDKVEHDPLLRRELGAHIGEERRWLLEPEWMGEPELR